MADPACDGPVLCAAECQPSAEAYPGLLVAICPNGYQASGDEVYSLAWAILLSGVCLQDLQFVEIFAGGGEVSSKLRQDCVWVWACLWDMLSLHLYCNRRAVEAPRLKLWKTP